MSVALGTNARRLQLETRFGMPSIQDRDENGMDHAGRKAVEDTVMNESALQGQVELVASKMSTETASNEVDRVPVDCRVNVEKSPVEDDGVGAYTSMLACSRGELAAV